VEKYMVHFPDRTDVLFSVDRPSEWITRHLRCLCGWQVAKSKTYIKTELPMSLFIENVEYSLVIQQTKILNGHLLTEP
jgi:hypothetical protein